MAVVYKAKQNGPAGFEKTVVVKAMLPGLITNKELVDLFTAEAKLSAQLSHPNIAQVHDFGVANQIPYLVMEYLNGRNLTQMRGAPGVEQQGRLAIGAALGIARDVCLALGYAHGFTDSEGVRRQIIHRDVSPSNVMVCRDGTVKLLDFGVAKVAGQFENGVTQSFRGKYAYMSPEQVNRQPIDRRVDVFAVGIVLHEMLTGKRLFAAPSELETLERVSAAQVEAPSKDNPEVPRALDAIVIKALERDPNARYGSGAEMAAALEELSGLTFSRKQLAAYLAELFPDGWTVRCDVCGKQAAPRERCEECGSEASSAASEAQAAPSERISPALSPQAPRLSLVPTAVLDDKTEETALQHHQDPQAASAPPKLFVVASKVRRPDTDDSVKMGRRSAAIAVHAPEQQSLPPPSAVTRKTLRPPARAPFAPPSFAPIPVDPTGTPAPNLRRKALALPAILLLFAGGIGGFGWSVAPPPLVVAQLEPAEPVVAPAPVVVPLPKPVVAPMPAPVPQPVLVRIETPIAVKASAPTEAAPGPVVVRIETPVAVSGHAPTARTRAVHRSRPRARQAEPRGTVKEGRIVDPFGGGD